MSPEQARGKPLDRRTDVFSFGCLLYECLTGQRAFRGQTVSDTMAAVLTAEPDWAALGADTPPRLIALLRRCLQKDPARRLRDIGDARAGDRGDPGRGERGAGAGRAAAKGLPPRRLRAPLVYGIAGLARRSTPRSSPASGSPDAAEKRPLGQPVRAVLPLPEGLQPRFGFQPNVAISPDGATVVFRASGEGHRRPLPARLAGGEAEPIPGTEAGRAPFFSPDGEWLGFTTITELKKVALSGGAPSRIVELPPVSCGATWMSDGTVVVARSSNNGLYRVPSAGGPLELLVPLDAARGEHALLWPQELPGGRGLLVTIVRGEDFQDMPSAEAAVIEPVSGKRHVADRAKHVRPVRASRLARLRPRAAPSSPSGSISRSLRVEGTPVAVREPFAVGGSAGTASFDVTRDGTLVLRLRGPRIAGELNVRRSSRPRGPGNRPASPSGRVRRPGLLARRPPDRPAEVRRSCRASSMSSTGSAASCRPSPPSRAVSSRPVWSPDGRQVAFSHLMSDDPRAAAAGGRRQRNDPAARDDRRERGVPERVVAGRPVPSLHRLVRHRPGRAAPAGDVRPLAPPARRVEPGAPLVREPGARALGRDLARRAVGGVRLQRDGPRSRSTSAPFPRPCAKLKISQDGGIEPVWTRGGREIVFRDRQRFLAAEFRAGAGPAAGAPRVLFSAPFASGGGRTRHAPRTTTSPAAGDEFVAIRPEAAVRCPNSGSGS